jgi:hypothetical protein
MMTEVLLEIRSQLFQIFDGSSQSIYFGAEGFLLPIFLSQSIDGF